MCCSQAGLALALALTFSCSKPETVHRVAVLRFENLSAAGADDDWIGRAISEEVVGQLQGTRHSSPVSYAAIHRFDEYLVSNTERAGAMAAGANRVVEGFYSVRNGRLSVTAVMNTAPSRTEKQIFSGQGPVEDLLHQCEQIARNIDEEAQPPITGSTRALRSYALGLDSAADKLAEKKDALYTEAIRLDPDFGLPYIALARIDLDRQDTAAFLSVFEAARARGSGIAAVDRAILNLDDAELHATPEARVDALAALVRITPADPFHLRELADAELEINRYAEAAEHYRRLAGLLPTDPEPVNRMGYALMYGGDEPAATKAFQDFRRLDHDSANSFDSTGDGNFFFNHFAEAERDYLAACDRDPNLTEGTEPLKAAWARLMLRDSTGAIQLVDRYLDERRKQNDPLAPFRAALVEELAGQRGRAKELLLPYLSSGTAAVRSAAETQIAVFENRAAQPSELGTAVTALLNKDYAQAVPEWRKLAEASSPNDWWTRTIYARALAETGQTQESHKYARFTPIPQPLRGVGFDEFWYPWIFSARNAGYGAT